MKILVTGGCGFIGSALIRYLIKNTEFVILNIDCLTNTSMPEALQEVDKSDRYSFKLLDICNFKTLDKIIHDFKPNSIIHLAAESHVDNSIKSPIKFINTNIIGTYNLLEVSRKYFKNYNDKTNKFLFLHVSTDEVYGSLNHEEVSFLEESSYRPNSPYSASKSSSDHLVRAWNKTYNIPTIITHCTNNYGPWQFPEKLIPLVISKCLKKESIPIYGNGENIRDWIYVDDHIEVLIKILLEGDIGEVYNIGVDQEISNIELVKTICEIFKNKLSTDYDYKNLITFIEDRPGHDFRYSINSKKIKEKFDFKPKYNFKEGIYQTIEWYINNSKWLLKKN